MSISRRLADRGPIALGAHDDPGRRAAQAGEGLPRPEGCVAATHPLSLRPPTPDRTAPDDPLRPNDRHDQRRDQGGPRLEARFRRNRAVAGVDEGAGRLRQPRRQARGEGPVRRALQGAPRLRLRHGGERPGRGLGQEPHLAHRSARRDHQFPARDPAFSPFRSPWSARGRSSPASSTTRPATRCM